MRRPSVRLSVNARRHACSLTIPAPPLFYSLDNNIFCRDYHRRYMFTDKGITALCEGLKGSAVTLLKCATAPECSRLRQRPLTHLPPPHFILGPFPSPCLPSSDAPPALLHSNSQAHTHAPCPFPSTHAMLPSIVRRVDLLDRSHNSLVASPSQLESQQPRRPGQAGHQRRRPQWHRDPILASVGTLDAAPCTLTRGACESKGGSWD